MELLLLAKYLPTTVSRNTGNKQNITTNGRGGGDEEERLGLACGSGRRASIS